MSVLINAVNNGAKAGMDSSSGAVRTMVFANTVEAAEAVAKILTGANVQCMRYHSGISPEERAENLLDFHQNGGVFVCTDAAARGLDIPYVSHVIQVYLLKALRIIVLGFVLTRGLCPGGVFDVCSGLLAQSGAHCESRPARDSYEPLYGIKSRPCCCCPSCCKDGLAHGKCFRLFQACCEGPNLTRVVVGLFQEKAFSRKRGFRNKLRKKRGM